MDDAHADNRLLLDVFKEITSEQKDVIAKAVRATATYRTTYTIGDIKQALLDSCVHIINDKGKEVPKWTKKYLSKKFKIPLRTFHYYCKKFKEENYDVNQINFIDPGAERKFTERHEIIIANWVQIRNRLQTPVTPTEFRIAVSNCYIYNYKRQHGGQLPRKEWSPGYKWIKNWSTRMKALGYDVGISKAKAVNAHVPTRTTVDKWFKSLVDAITSLQLWDLPEEELLSCIVNADETCVDSVDPKNIKVMGNPHRYSPLAVTQTSHDHITMVGICDAAGNRAPPYIIMTGKRGPLNLRSCKERMSECPRNAAWTCTDNGWITADAWITVLEYIVAFKKPTAKRPIILIVDCHSTRYDTTALEWARANHCHILLLPPNATAILQPLDVAVYSPFKKKLQELFNTELTNQRPISKVTCPKLVCMAWELAATKTTIRSGWRAANMATFHKLMSTRGMSSDLFQPETKTTQQEGKNTVVIDDNEWKMPPGELARFLKLSARKRKVRARGSTGTFDIHVHTIQLFSHDCLTSIGARIFNETGGGLLTTEAAIKALKNLKNSKNKRRRNESDSKSEEKEEEDDDDDDSDYDSEAEAAVADLHDNDDNLEKQSSTSSSRTPLPPRIVYKTRSIARSGKK